MKKKIYIALVWAAAAVFSSPGVNAQPVWPEVTKEMRPWTRWWWMGNAVNEKDLAFSLDLYRKAGIGGVEIAPIYGVKGYEGQYIDYLSPKWMNMLGFTVKKASEFGMGVDLTNGTGWPFGGPQISAPYAASKLIVQTYKLAGGDVLKEKIKVDDPKQDAARLQFVTAYSDKGEVLQLADKVGPDGTLNWKPKPASGEWELYAAFNGKTRQMVKRSSPGGEGFTLDHFSRRALDRYLDRFDQAFGGYPPGVRAFYNDSYEVYNADWTEDFLEFFKRRRGYDLRLNIREFTGTETSGHTARLKSDYRETMAEMLLENFTRPWTAWSRKYKAVTRNQAHGSPGNLLDLYAAVDIPECETFGSSYFAVPGLRRDSADIRNVDPDPVMLKFASSAGHVAGHNLISCETFTWLTEHFKTSLSQCKPEVEQVFLSGINHVFFHGTTYSPQEASWPGWLFYASVNFVPSNSFWPHLPGLTSYITRVQSVLQSGKADNELLLYWPVYDAWNRPTGRDMPLKVHDIDEWLHPTAFYRDVTELQNAGYSLDFISDRQLSGSSISSGGIRTSTNSTPYKVLLVPKLELMPVETFEKILRLAEEGATVIFQAMPEDVPGLGDLEARRGRLKQLVGQLTLSDVNEKIKMTSKGAGKVILASDVNAALEYAGILRETLTDTGLKFIRRDTGTEKYYYLVNHTGKAIDGDVPFRTEAGAVVLMDPQTGSSGSASFSKVSEGIKVRLQIQPGEAMIVKVLSSGISGGDRWQYLGKALQPIEVIGQWKLHFASGGPEIPKDTQLDRPKEWTSLADTAALNFSGLADYTVSFNFPKVKAPEFILDLGNVRESARVWINGQEAGTAWSIPYRLRIGKFLRPGRNTLRIEVANLMANRIRYMDWNGIEWKKFHDANIVDINYKPLNAANWKVQPSGLGGTVRIIPYSD